MKKITKSKGFTLIELLVVIAIIGILAAIVLASLSTARSKAQSAKVEGQLDEMRNAAEIYYSTAGNYSVNSNAAVANLDCNGTNGGNLFTDVNSGMNAIVVSTLTGAGQNNVDCGVTGNNATAWSAAALLPGGGVFCVDSTGAARLNSASGNVYTTPVNASCNATVCGAHATAGASSCI